MCGVTGMIGRAKDDKIANLSYQLSTELLKLTVTRGSHATGVYALFPGEKESDKNRLFIYKLDAPSTQFVNAKKWKAMRESNPFMLLGHCRFATHGDFSDHSNNHPHFSDDKKLAVVHNGVISGYTTLKTRFPVKGECDSEVILRIMETKADVREGIEEVFKQILSGSMACLASYYDTETRISTLYAFRNTGNPLVYIDLREEWGQVFFASTEDIAEKALKNAGLPKELREKAVVEIPDHEIWSIDSESMEFEVTEVEKPVSTGSYYGNGNGGYRSRNYNSSAGSTSTTGSAAPTSRQITTTGGKNRSELRKVRALLDMALENLTEIDSSLDADSEKPMGMTWKDLEEAMKDISWDLETIVNPSVVDDTDEQDETRIIDLDPID